MNQNLRRNVRNSAAAAALALLVAACGGGGGGSDSAQTPPPSGGTTNSPPTISGQPGASVLAGQQYSFQPSAADANNDSLTFTITNKPAWAQFNAANGALSGAPTSADVGAYSGITIQVSDGRATASIGPFAITVTEVANGVATLSWTPPTQNTDGSSLSNLSGYEIRYGRTPGDLSQTVSLTNPSLNTYVIENLSSGTWYFALAAISGEGVRSSMSNVAAKTI